MPSDDSPGLARLEGLIGYTLRRAQVAVSRSFVELFADLDVRQSQLGVLTVIEGSPGLRPSQVGAAIGITLMVFKGRDHNVPLAFGPYLAIAGGIALFFGPALIKGWYL